MASNRKTSKIKVSIVSNELSPAVKEEMWDVYSKYYDYSKAYFMERMEKNNHFSLFTVENKIIGFTGLRINRTTINGKKRLLFYFGQTIIDANYRGKSLIPTTGAKLCLKFLPELLTSKSYFWADCLTYKAYLVITKTLKNGYPSYKNNQLGDEKDVVDYIGKTHYGNAYCPQTGTVKKDAQVVNDVNTQIPFKYRQDPDINFYVNANPLYIEGHGLIALGPVTFTNFAILLKRMAQKTFGFSPKRKTAMPLLQKVRQYSKSMQ